MTHIVHLMGDDWAAIYFDGQMIDQGHMVHWWEVMRQLAASGEVVESYSGYDITEFG